eukprot:6209575-Pleurochrysis_carterae.AAC.2
MPTRLSAAVCARCGTVCCGTLPLSRRQRCPNRQHAAQESVTAAPRRGASRAHHARSVCPWSTWEDHKGDRTRLSLI